MASTETNPMIKRMDRMKKLKELHMKRNEGSRINHQEVVEEYKKSQLPKNWTRKQEWVDKKLTQEEERDEAKAQGNDYERQKLLDVQADEAEKWDKRKKAKHDPDPGFSGFEAATARQYQRDVKNFKPDREEYELTKAKMGEEAFYADKDTLLHGLHKDSKAGIDRMVQDLEKRIDKRTKFSRRRRFDDGADVDYINERNMRFNKKLERYYGQYTTEIKQNLERGTAV